MFLCDFSVRRPIAVSALLIALSLAGFNAYRKIGLDNMPELDIPYITVTTIYPGASPEEIELDVAKKIEDAVSTIDGLKHVHSTCIENMCLTLIEFDLSINKDVAATDVRERLDLIEEELPEDAESPKIVKFDPNSKPVATILLTGKLPLDQMYDYADETLSDRFSVIEGVAEVQISGGEELELQVTIDRKHLAAVGLTSHDVAGSLLANNVKIPSGTIKDGKSEISVNFDAEFKSLEEVEALEIGKSENGRICLRDVAKVEMASKEKRTLAFLNDRPAVNMKIIKKGGANAVNVVKKVREVIEEARSTGLVPGGLELTLFTDDAGFIEASMDDAWGGVAGGIILTSLILFLFLHEFRLTLIVAVSMPVSVLMTFFIMPIFGYTFNNSTLLAFGTSVGVLVTNSIVVIENITRKIAEGMNPAEASSVGSSEVALPVFASASTNVVVFIPIAMMSSIVGRYFTPFAVVMTGATLISLAISFTLTPLLSSVLLRKEVRHGKILGIYVWLFEGGYKFCENWYMRSIVFFCRRPLLLMLIVSSLFVASFVFVAPKVGFSFFPDNDRGEFIIKLEYPTYYNIDETCARTMAYEKKIRALPETLSCSTVIGKVQGVLGQVSEGVYLAEITVKTSGKNERKANIAQMKDMYRKVFEDERDLIATVNVPSIVGGAQSDIELEIAGESLDVLKQIGIESCAAAAKSGMLLDVDSNIRSEKPEIRLLPRRPILRDMKLSARLIGLIIRGNIEGFKQGTYKSGDRSFDIRVQFEDEIGREQLKEYTHQPFGKDPLGIESVAQVVNDSIPVQINRGDKRRIVKIFANPAAGVPLGNAVSFFSEELKRILPQGYSFRFAGKVEKMKEAQADFLQALIAASILTYLLICACLESWTQPVIILATLPLALIGVLCALYLSGDSLSMMGLLGLVMLIGIVVNNAILIIENTALLRSAGMPAKEAILVSSKLKFRPIVMTSLAAVIGMAPMAFGSGLGSEIRSSCGIAVIGGLVSSTILSLYVIPVLYSAIYSWKWRRSSSAIRPEASPSP